MPATLSEATTDLLCDHCGEQCGDRPVTTGAGSFCCAGCESVFTLLHREGLGRFYRCDVAPGVSQRGVQDRAPDRFAPLDDPLLAAAFVEFRDGDLARARFAVPALHCASCVWLIERLWRIAPGVVASEVDLLRQTVRVTYRPGEITLRAIAERLGAIGYEPVVTPEQATAVPSARRRLYRQIGVAGFAFGNIMIFSIPRYVNGGPLDDGFQRLFDALNFALAVPVLLFSASDWFRAAWQSMRVRRVTLEVPVALGLAVIFGRSAVEILSGVGEGFMDSFSGLVLFLLVGRLFQQKTFEQMAFDRTYRSFFPLSVRVERDAGYDVVPLERVAPGDRIVVRPQELVPADAVLLEGHGAVDYAFATGEQTPIRVDAGETVRAGGRVVGATLRLRVTRSVPHGHLASLWNNPVLRAPKPTWATVVADRFGFWFTVAAVTLAMAGGVWWWPDVAMSVQVATAVLIIACPCALTMAAPVTLGTALGQLGQRGLYLRHTGVLLDMSRIDTVAFDKTGTLTTATAPVVLEHGGLSDAEWRLVRAAAAASVHPVSRALADSGEAVGTASGITEVPGLGLAAVVDGCPVRIGTAPFVGASTDEGDVTHVAVGDSRGWIRLAVPAREGIDETIAALAGAHDVRLVSGDHGHDASRWRPLFGHGMAFRQSPDAKLSLVENLRRSSRRVLMVGDGLNDAGALAAADVGVAVSDATACIVPACDAVVAGSHVRNLPAYLRYARRARHVIVLCFALSVAYNAVGLSLALAGLLSPLVSAVLMPVSSLTVIGISAGAMRWSATRQLPS